MHRVRADCDGSGEKPCLPAGTDNAWRSSPQTTGEHSTDSHWWRNLFRRFCSRQTWINALKLQAVVVRNAAGSIACAWIPNALYTFGNIFSGKWYTDQSRNELLIANSVYASITFCTVVFISFMPMMLSLQFADDSDRRPTVWFCIKKLMRATTGYFIATTLAMFGFSCLMAYLDSIEPVVFKFKIECYADNFLLLTYFTGITRAVKNIFYEETKQGQDKLGQKQQKSRKPRIVPTAIVAAIKCPSRTDSLRAHTPTFWRAYVKGLAGAAPPFLACIFVHVLSQQRIVDQGNAVLTGFVVAGIVFKLAIQELAKHYIFKKRVRSARVMCVLVGIPTVLIDTQTRIILLGTNNTQTAVAGTLGMACFEITVRAGKAALVMWEILHHKVVCKRKATTLHQREISLRRSSANVLPEVFQTQRSSLSSGVREFELWRRQVHAFHTAELNADMYAEYISIGCSASILFFYGNHPHYSLLRQTASTETADTDMMTWRLSQLRIMVLQLGMEVVVDYFSIVLEMVIGIEFDHVKHLGSFLAALFMIAAVMNITISMSFYLG